jgi:hypothetical protein
MDRMLLDEIDDADAVVTKEVREWTKDLVRTGGVVQNPGVFGQGGRKTLEQVLRDDAINDGIHIDIDQSRVMFRGARTTVKRWEHELKFLGNFVAKDPKLEKVGDNYLKKGPVLTCKLPILLNYPEGGLIPWHGCRYHAACGLC